MKKIKKKYKVIIALCLVLVLIIGASLYTVLIRSSINAVRTVYEPTSVNRGDISLTVSESGSITYAQSYIKYDLDLEISDDDEDEDTEEENEKYLVIEAVYKAAGESVKEGDALIKFSEKSIESVRRLLAASLSEAIVDYNDAKSEYELGVLEAETDYKTKQITEKYAKDIYKASASQITDNISSINAEIAQLVNKRERLNEELETATEKYNDSYDAYLNAKAVLDAIDKDIAFSTYNNYQSKYISAQSAYYNALNSLDNVQNSIISNEEKIAELRVNLKEAENSKDIDATKVKQTYEENLQSGENAYLVYSAKLESLSETLKAADETLKNKEKQQTDFEELVGDLGIIYAPDDGLIVSVNVEAGDELASEKNLISYVTNKDLTITVNVTEEDIISMAIGDSVNIEFNAYPESSYTGSIVSIETTANSTNTNTVSYPVVISIPGDLSVMYGGMTTKVTFTVDESKDTLYISRKALIEKNGFYYVYVINSAQEYELRKIEVGIKNTTNVEVISGLYEGDTVYIATTGA